ncbi:glucosidase 2 subunit beta-like [Pollicipes pollicipes]|uniref:glucosidase 2 subunit beta-like n=1 Tax=Pollicipes pollicipes TaxID=41117 RepID=UPI001884FC42|nr:glucosidase 2 subunit beta-like [Pollicipes pollicipes]
MSPLLLLLCVASLAGGGLADLALPRGVSVARASLYTSSDTFTCLDGSDTVPFGYINDDYCDCADGSDEPGTSACASSHFYCPNRGHAAVEVPSAWVNDGVCDCCDGSDEYSSGACANTCEELGAETRARQQQLNEMRLRGYEVKLKLIEQGEQKLNEKKVRLAELAREQEVAEGIKTQREAAKDAAEEQERLLLEVWQEARRQQEQEQEAASKQQAEETFTRLDANADGKLTAEELQQESRLDRNADGTVSKDEVDVITMNKDELEVEEFVSSTWPLLKSLLHVPDGEATPPPPPPTDTADQPDQPEEHEEDEDDEELLTEDPYESPDDEDSDEDEDRELDADRYRRRMSVPAEPAAEPEYDEATQAAVDAAKLARSELQEAEGQLGTILREISGVEAFTGLDLGPERAFAGLYHECFVLENREYEYKLCMFDRASQKPRSGGVETSLGKWGSWEQPDQNGYTRQLYENGQQCWNGPKRSAHVTLTCGEETRVLDVTEPAKCEYRFSVETPAVCERPSPETEQLYHDEL